MSSNTRTPTNTVTIKVTAPTPTPSAPARTPAPRPPVAPQPKYPPGLGLPHGLDGGQASQQRTPNLNLSAQAREFVPRTQSNSSSFSSLSTSTGASFHSSTQVSPLCASPFRNPSVESRVHSNSGGQFLHPHASYAPAPSGHYGDDFFPADFSTLGPKQREKKGHIERDFQERTAIIMEKRRAEMAANEQMQRAEQQWRIAEQAEASRRAAARNPEPVYYQTSQLSEPAIKPTLPPRLARLQQQKN